jgi:phosphoserine phosphatase
LLTGEVVGPIVDRQAKADALARWCSESGVEVIHSIAVGDGANDLGMMELSGLSVAFNAKPKVRQAADLVVAGDSLSALISVVGVRRQPKRTKAD